MPLQVFVITSHICLSVLVKIINRLSKEQDKKHYGVILLNQIVKFYLAAFCN